MTKETTYRIYTVIIFMMFLLPAIQRNWHIVDFSPLKGSSGSHPKQKLTAKAWFDGSFQEKTDQYCGDSFGFRPPLVRMINQTDYELFNKANAHYVVVGKNNCLYETPYIEAHLGMDFLGDTAIRRKVRQLSMVRDTLKTLGVDLQVIYAPGKGSYFPEYIPDYYQQYQTDSTQYDRFRYHMDRVNFPYLDLNAYFRAIKDTTSYPLFPLTGIHWSKYGMVLASDTILKYWNSMVREDLPELVYEYGYESDSMEGSDSDVEDGMNLMTGLRHFTLMYPKYRLLDSSRKKVKTAVIADSYYWGLFDIGLSTIASDSGEFWYYFKQVFPQNFTTGLMIKDLDLKEAIESKDIITILQTDATLERFGFGFVEAAYNLYFGKKAI